MKGGQVIYDISARTSEQKPVVVASSIDFKGSAQLSGLSTYALYETYDDKTKETLLVMLPFANTAFANQQFDLKYLKLGHLQGTFNDADGRTLGVFIVVDESSSVYLYNFSIVQIYGASFEGATK